jgi:hypothetical protein
MPLVLNSSGGGSVTLVAPSTASNVTLTAPAVNANIITNKTPGAILQVVQSAKTDTYSASVASGGESGDVSGLSCSITPSSTSNKILVTFAVNVGCITNQFCSYQAYCNGSLVAVGEAAGSRKRATASSREIRSDDMVTIGMTFLHSPSSTSQQTYTIRLYHGSGGTQTLYVNRTYNDDNASYSGRGISTITAQEIAA